MASQFSNSDRQEQALTSADPTVGRWLMFCAFMVLLIVVIGGVTRLTESGLSITEWRPVSGVIPPLNEQQWHAEFAKYQQIPEFQRVNSTMTLAQFKRIFFWEYLHRLWGRLVGLVVVVPLLYFLMRGRIHRALLPRLVLIVVLIGLQGALGWFMVQSGLSERTDVSQYRLAAHLSLALVIYAFILWTGWTLLFQSGVAPGVQSMRVAAHVRLVLVFVALTIVAGAFVAGLNAGRIYNTFPLMNGQLIAPGYLELSPWYRNLFENPVAAQFNHRLLAILTVCASVALWVRARGLELPPVARTGIAAIGVVSLLQGALGVATLLQAAPIVLAAAHQLGAVLLLTASLLALRGVTPVQRPAGLYFALHRRGVAPRA